MFNYFNIPWHKLTMCITINLFWWLKRAFPAFYWVNEAAFCSTIRL